MSDRTRIVVAFEPDLTGIRDQMLDLIAYTPHGPHQRGFVEGVQACLRILDGKDPHAEPSD